MGTVFALDFDRTYTRNPPLWGWFAKSAVAAGNEVLIVSRRPDTKRNRNALKNKLGQFWPLFKRVLLVGQQKKDAATKAAGVSVDVWIDDSPQHIRAESRSIAGSISQSKVPVDEDTLAQLADDRAFCATGEGGGVDNSCSSKDGGGSKAGSGTGKKGRPRPARVPTRRPSKREISLAGQTGKSRRHIDARKAVAAHFLHTHGSYRDHKSGKLRPLDRERFEGQMQAIDWSQPVVAGPPPDMPPPDQFVQWQAPGNIPPPGGYFARPGVKPESLGIGMKAIAWNLDGKPVVERQEHVFKVTGAPKFIRSTAAPTVDNWGAPGIPQVASGGGLQWFVPEAQSQGEVPEFELVSSRAFCPTGPGGGVDNSCSSKDGSAAGTVSKSTVKGPPAPDSPENFYQPYSDGLRRSHMQEVADRALADYGMVIEHAGADVSSDNVLFKEIIRESRPPRMDAIQCVSRGLEVLAENQLQIPGRTRFERLPDGVGGYFSGGGNGKGLHINSEFKTPQVARAIRTGWLAGDENDPEGAVFVHESSHLAHWDSLRGHMRRWLTENLGPERADQATVEAEKYWVSITPGTIETDGFGEREVTAEMAWSPDRRLSWKARATKAKGAKTSPVLSSEQAIEVAKQVSRYAATQPAEFIAEVRTGHAYGKRYTKEVYDLYQDYAGPPLGSRPIKPLRKPAAKKTVAKKKAAKKTAGRAVLSGSAAISTSASLPGEPFRAFCPTGLGGGIDNPCGYTADNRAFCPGASPPDNSCSPANKGVGDSYGFTTTVEESKDAWGKSTYKLPNGEVKKNYRISLADPETGGRASLKVGAHESEESDFQPTGTEITIVSWHASSLQDIVDGGLEGAYKKNVGKGFGRRVMASVLEAAKEHAASVVSVFAPSDFTQAVMQKYTNDGLFTPIPGSKAVSGDYFTEFTINRDKVEEFLAETKRRVKAAKRAFCPGASPPDNSCSPANKGDGSKDGIAGGAGSAAIRLPSIRPDKPSIPDGSPGRYSEKTIQQFLSDSAQSLRGAGVRLLVDGGELESDIDTEWAATVWSTSQTNSTGSRYPQYRVQSISEVAAGVERLKAVGLAPPKSVNVTHMESDRIAGSTRIYATGDRPGGEVEINARIDHEHIAKSIMNGWTAGSATDPLGSTLVHEATHAEHFESLFESEGVEAASLLFRMWSPGQVFTVNDKTYKTTTASAWSPKRRLVGNVALADGKEMSSEQARSVAAQVSQYATTEPLEFVAEVRTGLAYGASYSKEVLGLYRAYGGPPLPDTKGSKNKRALSVSDIEAVANAMSNDSRAFCPTGPGGGIDNPCGYTADNRAFCPGASPPDNSCSPANKGDGSNDGGGKSSEGKSPKATGKEILRDTRPQQTTYSPEALIAKGAPSEYEGGDLLDGQTLWDRYDMPRSIDLTSNYSQDDMVADESLASYVDNPYSADSEQYREDVLARLPLRRQHNELMQLGATAMGVGDLEIGGRTGDTEILEKSSDAWVARAFTSSITNELMSLRSRTSHTEDTLKELKRQEAIAASVGDAAPTQEQVDRLVKLARETQLPDGVTLFHGMAGAGSRELLESLASSRGSFTTKKLMSTTTRPSVATQFADDSDWKAAQEDKAATGERIYPDGSLGSVVRIVGAKRGLPVGGVSNYRGEAEVVVAPETRLRFTGAKRIVYVPAGNDTGWPSSTFSVGGGYRDRARALWPMVVYDAVMED